jgi:hypothetical protein
MLWLPMSRSPPQGRGELEASRRSKTASLPGAQPAKQTRMKLLLRIGAMHLQLVGSPRYPKCSASLARLQFRSPEQAYIMLERYKF